MKYCAPLFVLLTLFVAGCMPQTTDSPHNTLAGNPLLQAWNTPFGVPPFDLIKNEHYLPALREGMAMSAQEIQDIINNPEEPTFANTIEALERAGKSLSRSRRVFFSLNSAHSSDEIRAIAKTITPELSAHNNDIFLNIALYNRVSAVFSAKDQLNLTAEQLRLLGETHKSFVRNGINLPLATREKLKQMNTRLSVLAQEFGQNLLKETNAFELVVENKEDLGELPESLVAIAAKEAASRGYEGKWVFTLHRPSINPFLQYSPNRALRKKLFDGYAMRGDNDNENDNKAILLEMANLRAERAGLMGYQSHAHYVLENRVAKTPAQAQALLSQVWPAALRMAKEEKLALEDMMHKSGVQGELQGSDWRHYSEKVRKARYAFDENVLRPYFEVNAVRDGVFVTANRLFGITFHPRTDIPKWHPDQQVFEVKEADGTHIGVVYLDLFARESKRGGAWMNSLRTQSKLDGDVHPIVTTNFNFPAPTETTPSLLSYREAETFFHEFGHAIHGLFSDVTYESLAGTSLPRDFVEFPSQVLENWMSQPEVLNSFAKHYKTGEVIPEALVEKLQAASKFNQGFATVEYMAAAYLDLDWHSLAAPTDLSAREFERASMERIGLIEQIIPRYRSGYFSHIFSGGYSAGYYGYLWSEVFDADAFAAFEETSLFDQETAQRFRREILSKGNTMPGVELYRNFRGRDPEITPLLKRRGLL